MDWNRNPFLKWGITIVLFLWGLFCMLKSYGYASEASVPLNEEFFFQHYQCRIFSGGQKQQPPTKEQKKEWQEAYDNHHFHAVRTYTDAYNRVWFLPNLSWRQLGRDAWVSACATAGGSTVSARLVIAFSAMLSSYGLHCLDEWDYIQEKLYWSQYHFEQCQHYASLLHRA